MLPLKALLRLYRAHPWLLLMSLAGLTLGVTLVVAIELLNHSARTNFVAARSQLAGEANYRLAPQGGLDEQVYVRLVRSQPSLDAMPELHAWLKGQPDRSVRAWLIRCGAEEVEAPCALYNLNTVEDLRAYEAALAIE